jgi:hypothetical protein
VASRTFTNPQYDLVTSLTTSRNINVFAMVFIVTFAMVFTICNLLILRFLIFLSRFRTALAPRIDHWVQDGVFQLQRRAFEAQGSGCWIGLEKEVPITLERERLKELPVDSSLALKATDRRRLTNRAWLKRSGTNITEETLIEDDEEAFGNERLVKRPTTGTDKVTLISSDSAKELGTKRTECVKM